MSPSTLAKRHQADLLVPGQEELGVPQLSATFEAYVAEAWRLKELYAPRIRLLVGVETEFINDEGLDRLVQLLERHGDSIQYVVGSVHHCREQPIDFDKARFDAALGGFAGADDDERFSKLFSAYFDAQYTLLQRLRPAVIGHFDLCRLYYPDRDFKTFPDVWSRIERNIRLGVEYGALFEINASAFRKGWSSAYPGPDVFEVRTLSGVAALVVDATSAGDCRSKWTLHLVRRLSWTSRGRTTLRQDFRVHPRPESRRAVLPRRGGWGGRRSPCRRASGCAGEALVGGLACENSESGSVNGVSSKKKGSPSPLGPAGTGLTSLTLCRGSLSPSHSSAISSPPTSTTGRPSLVVCIVESCTQPAPDRRRAPRQNLIGDRISPAFPPR